MKTFITFSASVVIVAATTSLLSARDYSSVDFNKATGYTSIDIYDTWEQSPFRTGLLKGNYAIVPAKGIETNGAYETPDRVLGAQRSRFGSNTFGIRINLADTFMLTPDYKYVHVIMHRPVDGRVMLVGIGGSSYFPTNGNNVEQFWETSLNNVKPHEWTDAVFAVKGFSNSSVNSLVVVPECESPHNRADDFPFYIASIIVNDSPIPLINYENYSVSAGSRNERLVLDPSSSGRAINSITIESGYGKQTIEIPQSSDRMLYRQLLSDCVAAKPGDRIYISTDYSNPGEMDASVYIDWNCDGVFEYSVLDNGVPTHLSEIVSYSFANNRNSEGANLHKRPADMRLPQFKIPENIRPGVYRMRVNVDNNSIDPAGSSNISRLGGSITDIMLNIHDESITINDNQLNGEVLAANGGKLNNYPATFGEEFTIQLSPEKGFKPGGAAIRYGNLSGDSIIMENPQYFEADLNFSGKTFTIPSKYMRGDILLMGRMIEQPGK